LIAGSDLLMLQLEIPVDRVLAAIEIARRHRVPVMLDPAPAPAAYPPELLRVELICPNATEASMLSGLPVGTLEEARTAAEWLHAAGTEHVAITLGAMGACLLSEGRFLQIEPYPVEAIDTTAAGDAFAGALAVRWRQTGNLVEALQFANAAGALAASRRGAQASMANFHEIETWMRSKK
jgi:ribokinase